MSMEYEITQVDDRIRVTITKEGKEAGSLYFEKAKKGFANKPLSMGSWACIDAKIEDDTIFSETLTPKDIVNECQELIKENGF